MTPPSFGQSRSLPLNTLRVLRCPPDKQHAGSPLTLREGVSWAMARSFLVADLAQDNVLTGVFVVILVSTVLAALPVEYNIIRFVRDPLWQSSSVPVKFCRANLTSRFAAFLEDLHFWQYSLIR